MHGNVCEWCSDFHVPFRQRQGWYKTAYQSTYPEGEVIDPDQQDESISHNGSRVIRGGSWRFDPGDCRSAHRIWEYPFFRGYDIGFRVAAGTRL
jgi:formylglycine-generating enzyme required for sulfatase activity